MPIITPEAIAVEGERGSSLERKLSSIGSLARRNVEYNIERLLSRLHVRRIGEATEQLAEYFEIDIDDGLSCVTDEKDFIFGNPNGSYAILFSKGYYLVVLGIDNKGVVVSSYDFLRGTYIKRRQGEKTGANNPVIDKDPHAPLINNFRTPLYTTSFNYDERSQGIAVYEEVSSFLRKHANPKLVGNNLRDDMHAYLDSQEESSELFDSFESYVRGNGYREFEKHEILILVSELRRKAD